MSAGQKILDGLKDAVVGNFSRVTIEGQTWVRVFPETKTLARAQYDALIAAEQALEIVKSHYTAACVYYQEICATCGQNTPERLAAWNRRNALWKALRAAGIEMQGENQ